MEDRASRFEKRRKGERVKMRSVLLRISDEEHQEAIRVAAWETRPLANLIRHALREYCRTRTVEDHSKADG